VDDQGYMEQALRLAASVEGVTAPNPWVGCVLVRDDGSVVEGRTHPPGGPHAEADALARADGDLSGATAYVSLEPCDHHGRTPPCTDALIAAGVGRVVVAMEDPDPLVAGRGIAALREAGIAVEVGICHDRAAQLLAPYVRHRVSGRPFVTLKLAATLDGRTAAPDATSRWITGPEARADVHLLRARCDAIVVGAGTIRADDPELTVRDLPSPLPGVASDPQRFVLGQIPDGARVLPAEEVSGPIDQVLDELGAKGVLHLLVEGGPTVAGAFHRAGLVDRYVVYLAPALFGGDDARPLMSGQGAATIDDVWRGRLVAMARLGDDVRLDLEPRAERRPTAPSRQPLEAHR
jgi:diaminohydroxyphosphoribosylaminopyrimidine deaminase / 5-amino-6-(5-phosphoribosylamino)uracil reductase